jgi:hypothetical protein
MCLFFQCFVALTPTNQHERARRARANVFKVFMIFLQNMIVKLLHSRDSPMDCSCTHVTLGPGVRTPAARNPKIVQKPETRRARPDGPDH